MKLFLGNMFTVLRALSKSKESQARGLNFNDLMKLSRPLRILSDTPVLGSIILITGSLVIGAISTKIISMFLEDFPFLATLGCLLGLLLAAFLYALYSDTVLLWNLKYVGYSLKGKRLVHTKEYNVRKPAPAWMTESVLPTRKINSQDSRYYDHHVRIPLIIMASIQEARKLQPVTPAGAIPLADYFVCISRSGKPKARADFAFACQAAGISTMKAGRMHVAGVAASEVAGLAEMPMDIIKQLYPHEESYPIDIIP